ncbi:hypothetical protein PIROE2DRAFT_6235 [Piromyces sp. E2]|nr:hypothetical protein PIROE2DRAFT_6235 [Piromyces sp. E2]|eukprot:OUM66510.1 hypothetical protein PIROE2DRAFT_6235 [Piromyces sp. E2]
MSLDNTFWIKSSICTLPILLGFFLWDKLPSRIPQSYDFNGQPGWTLPKIWGIITCPLLLLTFTIFMVMTASKSETENKKVFSRISWMIPILSLVVNSFMLLKPAGYVMIEPFSVIIPVISLVFILLGIYMPYTKPNPFVGIRAPWINNDPVVWQKVNRFGGIVFVISGIIDFFTSFTSIGQNRLLGNIKISKIARIL